MPPPSTPNAASSTSPHQPLTPLSPVPDWAAALQTTNDTAIDEADEANVSFLRDSLESLDRAASGGARALSHIDSQRDPRRFSSQYPPPPPVPADAAIASAHDSTDSVDDFSRRERLQRVLARLNRIHDPPSSAAYSNRTPSPTRQRLYDWAPSQEEPTAESSELDEILAQLRRQHPDTHPDILRVLSQSQLDSSRQRDRAAGHSPATAELVDAVERRDRLRERRRRENEWVSLRSRAVLQRARREASPSGTERMLRYVMDRERSGLSEEEERARGTGWFGPAAGRSSGEQQVNGGNSNRDYFPLPPSANELRMRTLQERADAIQRRHFGDNTLARPPRISSASGAPTPPRIPTPPRTSSVHAAAASNSPMSSSHFLENALKYLNQLRSCYEYEDALSAAIDHGLATKEFFADKHDDFIMDLAEVDRLADSSWLQSATIFEGHQHATSTSAALVQARSGPSSHHSVEQINPHYRSQAVHTTGFDHPPGSTNVQPFDATRPWLSHQVPPHLHASSKSLDPSHDHWPVRVLLHSIDPDRMALQGTMEAYDVPQHPTSIPIMNSTDRPKAGRKNAPITTYLEGHIIDLATHSFLTPSASDLKRSGPHPTFPRNATPYTTLSDAISFPSASAHTDAANWRKLPPFNALPSDEEMARCILSKARMNEIHTEYIFMRWKERCFVHSKDDPCSEAERGGDQDRGHGLTISGFYYVSLRRRDGVVEGLYFDPTSTPYQHLRLRGVRTGWPAFEFR